MLLSVDVEDFFCLCSAQAGSDFVDFEADLAVRTDIPAGNTLADAVLLYEPWARSGICSCFREGQRHVKLPQEALEGLDSFAGCP